MSTGRSAWTTIGGTTPYYELVSSGADVGSQVVTNSSLDIAADDYRAVNWGVKAIQHRINELGIAPTLDEDGWFGDLSRQAVIWAQHHLGLVTGYTAGRVGMDLAKALFRPLFVAAEHAYGVPDHHVGGIAVHESSMDPGAVGYGTPQDKGLCQWEGVELARAFDPRWTANATAQRVAQARTKYASGATKVTTIAPGVTVTLQVACSIIQHNSPLWADQWFQTGVAPDARAANYVYAVINAAKSF